MKYRAVLLVAGAMALPQIAFAADAKLTAQQVHGREIVTRNCVVCHLNPNADDHQYGPPLNKAAANGDPMLMHQVIESGLIRMPGWKYLLSGSDIDDVVAYIMTIPVSNVQITQVTAPPANPEP
jgi:mono/diheme cytochrome c family protein